MEIILSCLQVAVWLQRSEAAIKKMARLGQIPYIKSGKGLRFILSELEDKNCPRVNCGQFFKPLMIVVF